MGIGVTGVANAIETLGYSYGSPTFLRILDEIMLTLTSECYKASALLAKEKGSFPLYDKDKYPYGSFIKKLPEDVQAAIRKNGMRNSHLISIAPTGTISLAADNVSSGIEPVFSTSFDRTIQTVEGPRVEAVTDYGARVLGTKPKTADECSVKEHMDTLIVASKWVDSAVSKTCNVGADVSFTDFKDIYMAAWKGGTKGCTTFRAAGKRMGILVAAPQEGEGAACYVDPKTGVRTCDE